MNRPYPEVQEAELRMIAGSCLANGSELVSEGLILLEEGRLCRALYLILAGYEEILKVRYCREGFPPLDWAKFWRGFRSHSSKLAIADFSFSTNPDGIEILLRLRERSMYVDVATGGGVLMPKSGFTLNKADLQEFALWLKGQIEVVRAEWDAWTEAGSPGAC